MKKVIALLFLLLSSMHFFYAQQSGVDTFLYRKGKSFKDVAALQMKSILDLNALSAPLLYESQVPAHQNTLSYHVSLPSYIRGIFFSRDSRPGDFEWPNNTNRLFPWVFNRLEEITAERYPGIPSSGRPSTQGDALLLELTNGEYLFAKAVTGSNSISWFRVNEDGTLNLYISTLGKDDLNKKVPLILCRKSPSIYGVFDKAYDTLIADREASSLKKREDKEYFEAFRYLGWCTFEHFYGNINEKNILKAMDDIEASGIPIRYLLVDAGHIASKKGQITSFIPIKERFPNGWTRIMARKQKDKIRWMGIWYCLSGNLGVSLENEFPPEIQRALYPYNGYMLPGTTDKNIQTFYQYYVHMAKEHGFDFFKTDNQSYTLPLYMGGTQVIRQAKECNIALEQQTHAQHMGLINCMAQNIVNTDHTQYSSVTRVSVDYKKYNSDMAKSHLFQSYTNTLLLGQTVWPDHDMFHSCDTICGSLMARSKAISGGPVYLSDHPTKFIKEIILPLVDEKGKIFRPLAPAIPTPESIFTNPFWYGKAYRVFAPTGDEAVSLICYNLNSSSQHGQVMAHICPADYLLRSKTTAGPVSPEERIFVYEWDTKTGEILSVDKKVELKGFTDKLFHLCPVRDGWAVVGIQEKYLSPSTVKILSRTPDKLVLDVRCSGTLKIWVESGGKQELRSIPVRQAGKIELSK